MPQCSFLLGTMWAAVMFQVTRQICNEEQQPGNKTHAGKLPTYKVPQPASSASSPLFQRSGRMRIKLVCTKLDIAINLCGGWLPIRFLFNTHLFLPSSEQVVTRNTKAVSSRWLRKHFKEIFFFTLHLFSFSEHIVYFCNSWLCH